jgi:hypothetical protein
MAMILDLFDFPTRETIQYHQLQTGFDFISRQSRTLLVTIGDSWTWGADLTPTQDQHYRISNVYGNVVAKHIGADFLNLAVGGSSNAWITEQFEKLVEVEQNLDYDNINCVITLTEVGREFDSHWDQNVDYLTWTNENIVAPTSYYQWLAIINQTSAQRIKQAYSKTSKMKLHVGTNFADHTGIDCLESVTFPKTWIDLYAPQTGQTVTGTCYVASRWVIDKFENILKINPNLNRTMFLTWMIDVIDSAHARLDIISHPDYFKRIHHPVSSGHRCWADYIIRQI